MRISDWSSDVCSSDLSRFLLFAARSRAPWRLLLLPLLLPVALLYALKIVPRRTMKQAMHRIAIGRALPQREAARLADRFARRLIADGLYTKSVALIERARANRKRAGSGKGGSVRVDSGGGRILTK